MRVLSLDTSTRCGSVALLDDDRVIEERSGDPARDHAERLPRVVLDLLAAHGLTTSDANLFAIVSGPGSFTGLRIGIATLQALAFVHHRRMAAVSALEALGHLGSRGLSDGAIVAVWMDAMRRDVFSALYRVGPFAVFDLRRLTLLDAPRVDRPETILERWRMLTGQPPAVFIGNGATTFAGPIQSSYPGCEIAPHPLLAGAVGRLGAAQAAAGLTIEPGAVRPLYVRRPDAEIERERRRAGG
jgi:tRNA threonylcarbamoyl adenosine modification protein YeaZ